MSTKPNDNAFPFGYAMGVEDGLTKREYIAAMAMQGMLANSELTNETFKERLVAAWSVDCADALIDELNKEEK